MYTLGGSRVDIDDEERKTTRATAKFALNARIRGSNKCKERKKKRAEATSRVAARGHVALLKKCIALPRARRSSREESEWTMWRWMRDEDGATS
jgi:hypothetical protein